MVINRLKILILLVVTVFSATLLIYSVWDFYQTKQYNLNIQKSSFIGAKQYRGDYGRYAHAYAKQEEGDYQTALKIYIELEQTKDMSLRKDIMFNSGNAYLEQALKLDIERDAESAFPLLELAKESFRRLLKLDSTYLEAKYNLERALLLLPDAVDKKIVTQVGFARLVKVVISSSNKDELP